MTEFEKNPHRTRLERLVSMMSIRTGPLEVPSRGDPGLTSGHWAAMMSGFPGDSETALCYVMVLAGEPHHRKPLINRLMYFLAPRVLMGLPNLSISGTDLRDVVAVTVDAERHGGSVTLADAARSGIKRKRWERLRPVHQMTVDALDDVADQVVRHLSRACS